MSDQLVLTINRAADTYRWCWLDAEHNPLLDTAGRGDADSLAAALNGAALQAWLIVPGTKVVTRKLEYSEKEKKHLRNLLPFQLEETVVGDVERFHFALGPMADGKAAIAYMEKAWLEQVFAQLSAINIEVTRCWSAPLVLPLRAVTSPVAEDADSEAEAGPVVDPWTLQVYEGVIMVRHEHSLGFSVDQPHAQLALELLLTAQKRVDNLPAITLRGATEADLERLQECLPPALQTQVVKQELAEFWDMDYSSGAIDLCQGEFSQRLPIERWWRNWRSVATLAAACLGVHIGILLYQIHDFGTENLAIRQQIEGAYRQVVPQGAIVDAERQLTGMVRELQPSTQGGSVVNLLAKVMPALAENKAVTLRSIQYIGDTGELNMQLQTTEYDLIQTLRAKIEQQGLNAELLGTSAQGDTHSARLKISQANR